MLEFIYNPIAGKGRAARFRAAIEARLKREGVAHRFHDTKGPRDAVEIARRVTRQCREEACDLVAMGGDGTLNEVLNGIEDPSRARLGIIPCGSGNDFAAAAGIPESPDGALELLLRGRARYTDYMECGGVRGINVIGTGIDVDILKRYADLKVLKGSAAYLAALVLTLFSYRARQFAEHAGDTVRQHRALIACAGNGRRIGGGIVVCPEAKIDDGLLDIVVVDDIPRPGIPGAFIRLLKKQILELPTVVFRRDASLRLTSGAPMPIQIDGEIYDDLPFDVRIVPNALRVYRP